MYNNVHHLVFLLLICITFWLPNSDEVFKDQLDKNCHHNQSICKLEIGPELENPPKIYSRFHNRNKFGYTGLTNSRNDNGCFTADITVTYDSDFPTQAKNAFQFAVEILERCIVSDIEIKVDAKYDPASSTNLASASSILFRSNFNNAPIPNTFYSACLANSLADKDLDPSENDFEIKINSNRSDWYFGVDGNCPSNNYDLVTVALHELCHGIGFEGGGISDGTAGGSSWGASGNPLIFDRLVELSNGDQIVSLPNGSQQLLNALVSNNLFLNGQNIRSANNGQKAKIYAPSIFDIGSSYSHFDESTYIGELMTPMLSKGEVIHDPSALTIATLQDTSWEIELTCYSGFVYVDKYFSGDENGTINLPFNTIQEAVNNAVPGNTILFMSVGDHNSSTPIIITKRLRLELMSGNNGPVLIK